MMQWEEAAQGFAAMGSEARLQVLRCLIRAGRDGLMVSEIQQRSGIAPSTLAHHLKFLTGAGAVSYTHRTPPTKRMCERRVVRGP